MNDKSIDYLKEWNGLFLFKVNTEMLNILKSKLIDKLHGSDVISMSCLKF